MTDEREVFKVRRDAGLAMRHETRIESREELRQRTRQEIAEDIAAIVEERADDLDPPVTGEWLVLRDWFKDQLHEVAAAAREIGSRDPE